MTDIAQLRPIVESAFEERQTIGVSTGGEVREAVEDALDLLDSGTAPRRREAATATGSSISG